MHKFVYPLSDTYVTNHPDVLGRNFGRDEILEISAETFSIKTYTITSSIREAITDFIGLRLMRFNGSLTGSLTGSASNISGSIIGCGLVLPEESDC